VRSARALTPNSLESGLPRACRLRHLTPHTLSPPSRPAPRPASHALLSTRQGNTAFNQPLSWDTSKVTNMERMFYVRSARALAPKP
jgi:surface protein